MDAIRLLLTHYRYAAIALVTVLTLGIVAAVVLTTTSAGCGPANKVGIKTARCVSAGPVAHLGPASPAAGNRQFYTPPPAVPPVAPPANPGASANPPYDPGSSSLPPYNPGSSAQGPTYSPASGTYPPMASPASGSSAGLLGISCRLPISVNGPGSGGFVVYPGGTFIADPRSAVTPLTSPSPAPLGPGPQNGGQPLTYDAAYSKWLPVPYAWMSPDGSRYAYALNGDLYVQSVSGGAAVDLSSGHGYAPLRVENNGVYVITPNQPGLWFLPFSGSAKQISSTGFWQGESHGAAYGTVTSQVPLGASNTILKLDTATGTQTDFFSEPGGQAVVTGFDAQGHPVIQAQFTEGTALYLGLGPNNPELIAVSGFGSYYYAPFPQGQPVGDSHGVWFWAGGGVVLFANGAWYAMSSIGGQLAGPCL